MLAGITALFTCYNVNAFNTINFTYCKSGNPFPNCSFDKNLTQWRFHSAGSDYSSLNSMNYFLEDNVGAYYTLNTGSNTSNGFLKTYNDGDKLSVGWYTYNSSMNYYAKAYYNFIKLVSDGGVLYYGVRNENLKDYMMYIYGPDNSIGGAYSDLSLQYVVPRHGSFTFYNAGYLSGFHTVQLIGGNQLVDRIIYVDTLDNSKNVWLIDLKDMVARSMYIDDPLELSNWLFGVYNLTDNDFINTQDRNRKYKVSLNQGGNSFRPLTAGNRVAGSYGSLQGNGGTDNGDIKSSSAFNIGLSYSDDVFSMPNYSSNSNGGNSSSNVIDYQKCVYDHQPINMMSKYMYSCKNTIDGEHTTDEMYSDYLYYMNNFDGSTPYSGLVRSQSCKNMLDYVFTLYSYSSGDLLDYHKRYIMAESYADVNGFDVESLCSMNYSSDQDQQAIDFIGEIQASFNSGYNYFNVPSCDSNLYGKSYAWGNFLLIFVGVWLLFILFSAF